MKKILVAILLLLLSSVASFAQADTTTPPYKLYPTIPAFRLLMLDSSTVFNTYNIQEGHPVLFMFFGPDCDHCHMLTDSILANMSSFKHVQICMLSPTSLSSIRTFYNNMNLKAYKNILVGKDFEYFFPKYYKAYYVPFLAVYDRHKKLVRVFDGGGKMADIIKAVE